MTKGHFSALLRNISSAAAAVTLILASRHQPHSGKLALDCPFAQGPTEPCFSPEAPKWEGSPESQLYRECSVLALYQLSVLEGWQGHGIEDFLQVQRTKVGLSSQPLSSFGAEDQPAFQLCFSGSYWTSGFCP